MFRFFKDKIKKVYDTFAVKAAELFGRNQLDEHLLQELDKLLLSADTGVECTKSIMTQLRDTIRLEKITEIEAFKSLLHTILLKQLSIDAPRNLEPKILLLVGVNGSGKTSFAAKYAHLLQTQGKRPLLVAGDTFRAAATEQLEELGKKINVEVFTGKENQDPASVIFDASTMFKQKSYDHIIIDTAGRLQTKVNLMRELEKIRKIIQRQLPGEAIHSWITIDAMLGQNSLEQAKIFHEATNLTGVALTKLDGTGKGGIVFAITQELNLPILYATFGEQRSDIKAFEPNEYVKTLLAS